MKEPREQEIRDGMQEETHGAVKEEAGKFSDRKMKEGIQPDCQVMFRVREHWIVLGSGVFATLFTLFILIMGLKSPSADGNRAVFFTIIFLLFVIDLGCCIRGSLHCLSVDGMKMYYVNWYGKKRFFTLDDIGYCKLELSKNWDNIIVYDLLGNKLCKLEFDMRGSSVFLQYLIDNQVRIEWKTNPPLSAKMLPIEAALRETAICEEEIIKYTEVLYGKVRDILVEWEKQNKILDAYWEFGFAQFSEADLAGKSDLWNRTSSIPENVTELPEDYVCIFEAYLKKDNEYVIDKKNEAVCILIPYVARSASYQIGEKLRLRKMNEDVITDWMKGHLELLAGILPKRKYHTEPLILQHELRKTAGIRK